MNGDVMNQNDVKELADIRQFLIDAYNSLDGARSNVAMIKQEDVAHTLGETIKNIDKILSQYVNFE